MRRPWAASRRILWFCNLGAFAATPTTGSAACSSGRIGSMYRSEGLAHGLTLVGDVWFALFFGYSFFSCARILFGGGERQGEPVVLDFFASHRVEVPTRFVR